MPRSTPVVYYPNPSPLDVDELPRYLDDELHRIRESLIAQPVALAVRDAGDVLAETTLQWHIVFIGSTPEWEAPGGAFYTITGVWTCPQRGLYQINIQLEIAAFGSGNKNYYAGIRMDINSGGAVRDYKSTDGGDDNIPLGIALFGMQPLLQGDTITISIAVVHEQAAGTAPYDIGWQILRVSD